MLRECPFVEGKFPFAKPSSKEMGIKCLAMLGGLNLWEHPQEQTGPWLPGCKMQSISVLPSSFSEPEGAAH